MSAQGSPLRRVAKYSREELVNQLLTLTSDLGRVPTMADLDKDSAKPSSGPFVREFGSWRNALKEAGLRTSYTGRYTDDQLLKAIKNLYKELGRVPTSLEMERAQRYPSSGAFKRAFGSFNAAVRAAGLKAARARHYTDQELLELLRILAQKMNRIPRQNDMNAEIGFPGATVYCKRFGSWGNALACARLETNG